MTDKKMIRDQQAEIDKLKQELQEMDKLKRELQERDAAEQERDAQHQVRQIEIDNLREQHEEAMNVIAKLNARATPAATFTDLGDADASKPLLSMDNIVTLVQREIKNASTQTQMQIVTIQALSLTAHT
jgi:septal ring factor EnvC (AmiA/AmiB activator)